MSSHTSPHQLGAAVLDVVQTGAYPDEEDVIAAELYPTALTVALQLLREAQGEVKVRAPFLPSKKAFHALLTISHDSLASARRLRTVPRTSTAGFLKRSNYVSTSRSLRTSLKTYSDTTMTAKNSSPKPLMLPTMCKSLKMR